MRVLYFLFFFVAFQVNASPVQDLNKYGEGKMSFMFWDLYKAELYGKAETFQPEKTPIALKITYLRDIDKQDLIDATVDQWAHLSYENDAIPEWSNQLSAIWPDIKEGNHLIIRVLDDGTSEFYDQNQKIGTMTDTSFGQAFISIWLSENTSEPKLRARLIGEKK